MGLQIKGLIEAREISIKALSGKVCCVDTFNLLYQFLTTIRSRDGSPLRDSSGSITSHLVGLFSRTTNLMEHSLKLAFVFDGTPPKLKQQERERRKSLKIEAQNLYEAAKKKEDLDGMKKYASRTSRLNKEMIDEAKDLIKALGLPVIQAPSEGEAQAAKIVKDGKADFCVSQDFDSLIHGAPNLVRNLSILGKRKKANKLSYETFKPEVINLSENLNNLGIDQNQLIALSLLVGTDYNIGGIKRIGPKNALKLVKQYNQNFDALFKAVKWDDFFGFGWEEVYYTIKKMPTTSDYSLSWSPPAPEKIAKILVEKHDFSAERVESSLSRLLKNQETKKQKGLGDFF